MLAKAVLRHIEMRVLGFEHPKSNSVEPSPDGARFRLRLVPRRFTPKWCEFSTNRYDR
jgi:hypothetical protein